MVLDNWNRLTVLSTDSSGQHRSSGNTASSISGIASPAMKSGQSCSLPRNTQPAFTSPSSSWKRYVQKMTVPSYCYLFLFFAEILCRRTRIFRLPSEPSLILTGILLILPLSQVKVASSDAKFMIPMYFLIFCIFRHYRFERYVNQWKLPWQHKQFR